MFNFIFTDGHPNDHLARSYEIEWDAAEAAKQTYFHNPDGLYDAIVQLIEDGEYTPKIIEARDTLVDETEDFGAIETVMHLIPEDVVRTAAENSLEE